MKFDYFKNWRPYMNTIFNYYESQSGIFGRRKWVMTPGLIDCFIGKKHASHNVGLLVQKPQGASNLPTSVTFENLGMALNSTEYHEHQIVWEGSTMYSKSQQTFGETTKETLKIKAQNAIPFVTGTYAEKEKLMTLDGECVKIGKDFYVRKPYDKKQYKYIKIDYQTGMPKLRREIRRFNEILDLLAVQPLFIEQIDASSLATQVATNRIMFFENARGKILFKGDDEVWYIDGKEVLKEIARAMSSGIDETLSAQMSMGVEFNQAEKMERQRFSDLSVKLFKDFSEDFNKELRNRSRRRYDLGIDGHIRMAPELSLPDVTEKKNTQLVACEQAMIEPKNPESEKEMGM